jgi:hypothetical protein
MVLMDKINIQGDLFCYRIQTFSNKTIVYELTVIESCRYIHQFLWNRIPSHNASKWPTSGVHAQLDAMLQIFWIQGYLKRPLPYKVPRFYAARFFSGPHEQASHHRRPRTKHSPADCSHSRRHVTACIRQFEASIPVVHGRRGQPLSTPYVTGRGVTSAEECTYNIWSPQVHKYWFYCWKSVVFSERITLYIPAKTTLFLKYMEACVYCLHH